MRLRRAPRYKNSALIAAKSDKWGNPAEPTVLPYPDNVYEQIDDGRKPISGPFEGVYKADRLFDERLKRLSKRQKEAPPGNISAMVGDVFERKGFLRVDPAPRQVDFDALEAIDIKQNGKLVRLSDKTLSDLLDVKVLNPATNLYENRRVNVADATLSLEQKFDALTSMLAQNQIVSQSSRNTMIRLISSILSESKKTNRKMATSINIQKQGNILQNKSNKLSRKQLDALSFANANLENLEKKLSQKNLETIVYAINKLNIPKGNHVAAGLPQRFYNEDDFTKKSGIIKTYLLAQGLVKYSIPIYASYLDYQEKNPTEFTTIQDIQDYLINDYLILDLDELALIPATIAKEYEKRGIDYVPEEANTPKDLDTDIFYDAQEAPLEGSFSEAGPSNFYDDNDLLEEDNFGRVKVKKYKKVNKEDNLQFVLSEIESKIKSESKKPDNEITRFKIYELMKAKNAINEKLKKEMTSQKGKGFDTRQDSYNPAQPFERNTKTTIVPAGKTKNIYAQNHQALYGMYY